MVNQVLRAVLTMHAVILMKGVSFFGLWTWKSRYGGCENWLTVVVLYAGFHQQENKTNKTIWDDDDVHLLPS